MENAGGTGAAETHEQQDEKTAKINQVYLLIISRYKDYIEEKEEISVAELPRFVVPKAPLVARKAAEIKAQFPNYSYEDNFDEAALAAFGFVKDEIEEIALPLQFWLSPEEILTFMAGDITDKHILLCSLLIALGNPSAKVVVTVDGVARAVKAYCEHGGKLTMFDIADGSTSEFKTRDEMLGTMGLTDDSTAYEFNDQMYVDIR